MNGEYMGITVWVFIVITAYLLWLGSDMSKDDERDHWDD